MSGRLLLGAAATAAGLGLICAQAGAVIVGTPTGPVSYAPHNAEGPAAGVRAAGGNLTYHGGPVMHTNRSYAIFWDPSSAFPAGYATLMSQYLGDVAGDSGLSTNVYSVGTQYSDSAGRAGYSASFGASLSDDDPYPPSGCPVVSGFSTCVTDAQLQEELDDFATANSLPRGSPACTTCFCRRRSTSVSTSGPVSTTSSVRTTATWTRLGLRRSMRPCPTRRTSPNVYPGSTPTRVFRAPATTSSMG